ncbi:MAG: hypothetical protein ACRC13_11510 [Tannerellaceae bacterium]
MIKSTIADIPFRKHPEYMKLTMPNKFRLLVMFHLWLGCDKKQVAFDAHFFEVMDEAVISDGFDFFYLDVRVRRAFRKIGLVATRQGYTFALDLHADEGYSKGVIQSFQEGTNLTEKSTNHAEKSINHAEKSKILVKKSKILALKKAPKSEAIEVITPMHDNFLNG